MAVGDVQPRSPVGRTGFTAPDDKRTNFTKVLQTQNSGVNPTEVQPQQGRQTVATEENRIFPEEKNPLLERNIERSGEGAGEQRNIGEVVSPEALVEFNPGSRIGENQIQKGIQRTEQFQINQINELNAEIARGTARRNAGQAIRNSLRQDTQLGGKVNIVG